MTTAAATRTLPVAGFARAAQAPHPVAMPGPRRRAGARPGGR